jgi:hypothetical protein
MVRWCLAGLGLPASPLRSRPHPDPPPQAGEGVNHSGATTLGTIASGTIASGATACGANASRAIGGAHIRRDQIRHDHVRRDHIRRDFIRRDFIRRACHCARYPSALRHREACRTSPSSACGGGTGRGRTKLGKVNAAPRDGPVIRNNGRLRTAPPSACSAIPPPASCPATPCRSAAAGWRAPPARPSRTSRAAARVAAP